MPQASFFGHFYATKKKKIKTKIQITTWMCDPGKPRQMKSDRIGIAD